MADDTWWGWEHTIDYTFDSCLLLFASRWTSCTLNVFVHHHHRYCWVARKNSVGFIIAPLISFFYMLYAIFICQEIFMRLMDYRNLLRGLLMTHLSAEYKFVASIARRRQRILRVIRSDFVALLYGRIIFIIFCTFHILRFAGRQKRRRKSICGVTLGAVSREAYFIVWEIEAIFHLKLFAVA